MQASAVLSRPRQAPVRVLFAEDFDACGVAEKARAEELSLGAWVCLAKRARR